MKESIIQKVNSLLKSKPKIPKCFVDEQFMYCFCGKCKPTEYDLPADFQGALVLKSVADNLKNNPTL